MKKGLGILLLFLLALSCTSEDGLTNYRDDDPDPPEPVELLFNEPFFSFGESLSSVEAQETELGTRTFVSSSTIQLSYDETKNGITYQITYHFTDDAMVSVSVIFDYDQVGIESLFDNLLSNYELVSNIPMEFIHPETQRRVVVENSVYYETINIDYY